MLTLVRCLLASVSLLLLFTVTGTKLLFRIIVNAVSLATWLLAAAVTASWRLLSSRTAIDSFRYLWGWVLVVFEWDMEMPQLIYDYLSCARGPGQVPAEPLEAVASSLSCCTESAAAPSADAGITVRCCGRNLTGKRAGRRCERARTATAEWVKSTGGDWRCSQHRRQAATVKEPAL